MIEMTSIFRPCAAASASARSTNAAVLGRSHVSAAARVVPDAMCCFRMVVPTPP
jgi:hypothetical protein